MEYTQVMNVIENLGLKVVFDNSHGEIVGVLSFSKEDYSTFASILQLFGCELDIITDRITPHNLQGVNTLIISVPTKPFQQDELYAIHNFVSSGGGLLLIGEYGGYANNDTYLNQIAQMFGVKFNRDMIVDTQARLNGTEMDPKKALVCPIVDGIAKHEVMEGIEKLRLELSCSLTAGGHAIPLAWTGATAFADKDFNYTPDEGEQRGNIIFLAAVTYGAGRVIFMGDSSLISNENMLDPNHARLGLNMVKWLGKGGQSAPQTPAPATATPTITPAPSPATPPTPSVTPPSPAVPQPSPPTPPVASAPAPPKPPELPELQPHSTPPISVTPPKPPVASPEPPSPPAPSSPSPASEITPPKPATTLPPVSPSPSSKPQEKKKTKKLPPPPPPPPPPKKKK